MFRSEISPSPHPSPTSSRTRAFEETSLASASPITPRAERDNLLRENLAEKREENQGILFYIFYLQHKRTNTYIYIRYYKNLRRGTNITNETYVLTD